MTKRLIPVLLLDRNRRLVKTEAFNKRTYIGDPFNVVRLFNEKEVDEICILDIDATPDGREPDFGFLRELATECFMPLAYGGGLRRIEQCEQLSRNGVEKFILGSSPIESNFAHLLSQHIGSQAVVACVDVRGRGINARCFTHSGKLDISATPLDYCQKLQDLGVGEIILQSIDLDGSRTGYDLELIHNIASKLTIPLVALGGAGEYQHLGAGLHAGASAAASGSAFTFIGHLRAVLIHYPTPEQINCLLMREL